MIVKALLKIKHLINDFLVPTNSLLLLFDCPTTCRVADILCHFCTVIPDQQKSTENTFQSQYSPRLYVVTTNSIKKFSSLDIVRTTALDQAPHLSDRIWAPLMPPKPNLSPAPFLLLSPFTCHSWRWRPCWLSTRNWNKLIISWGSVSPIIENDWAVSYWIYWFEQLSGITLDTCLGLHWFIPSWCPKIYIKFYQGR